jgi:transposase
VPDTPRVPASDEVAWLRLRVGELEELNARLREAAAARDELAAAQLAARDAQIAALAAQVEEMQRRLGKDSSASSGPPSSDSPYAKKPRDRSLRGRSGRKPGKQPGAQSSTLKQSPDPDGTVVCGPAACGCCGHDLAGEPVLGAPDASGAAPRPGSARSLTCPAARHGHRHLTGNRRRQSRMPEKSLLTAKPQFTPPLTRPRSFRDE